MDDHPRDAWAPPPEGTFAANSPTAYQEEWLRTKPGMIARLEGLEDNVAALQTALAEVIGVIQDPCNLDREILINALDMLDPKKRKELEEEVAERARWSAKWPQQRREKIAKLEREEPTP